MKEKPRIRPKCKRCGDRIPAKQAIAKETLHGTYWYHSKCFKKLKRRRIKIEDGSIYKPDYGPMPL